MSKQIDQTALQDIKLLLENSLIEPSRIFINEDGQIHDYGSLDTIVEEPEKVNIYHPQALLISKLYYQKNKETQVAIVALLVKKLHAQHEIARTSIVALFQISSTDDLLDAITDPDVFTHPYSDGLSTTLSTLNQLLAGAWKGFTKTQINKIREWCASTHQKTTPLGAYLFMRRSAYSGVYDAFERISNQINRILVRDVRTRIESGFNPEINEDVVRVKEELSKFGFPSDLSVALDKIDLKFDTSRDAFDFKGTMDLLRSFTERLYRSILDEYGKSGKDIKEQDSEQVAAFFQEKGLISPDFAQMLASQRHFLSNQASHRLKSREEDARLSKNMVIEMSLYLLRRVENN